MDQRMDSIACLWKAYCDLGTVQGIGETAIISLTLKPLPVQSCRDHKLISNKYKIYPEL